MCAFPISLSNPRLGQRRRRQPRLRQAAINPAKARKVARRASVAVPGCSILLSWAGKQHSALEHAHVLSAGLEKPLPRPGISLEELEQLLSYLPAAGFTGMHVIVGPHVLQRPDEAVRLAWPVAARPQIRSPQGDRRLHLAARGIPRPTRMPKSHNRYPGRRRHSKGCERKLHSPSDAGRWHVHQPLSAWTVP